jgi:hypothetical protein
MPDSNAYDAHQRQRWTRHDAHLWVRHDAARFLPPGMDPAELYPTLARKADAAQAAAFEAEVEAGYRLLATLREKVAELRAELRRELEAKYGPSQPRVPAGNPRGGQWSNRNEGGASVGFAGPAWNGCSRSSRPSWENMASKKATMIIGASTSRACMARRDCRGANPSTSICT